MLTVYFIFRWEALNEHIPFKIQFKIIFHLNFQILYHCISTKGRHFYQYVMNSSTIKGANYMELISEYILND